MSLACDTLRSRQVIVLCCSMLPSGHCAMLFHAPVRSLYAVPCSFGCLLSEALHEPYYAPRALLEQRAQQSRLTAWTDSQHGLTHSMNWTAQRCSQATSRLHCPISRHDPIRPHRRHKTSSRSVYNRTDSEMDLQPTQDLHHDLPGAGLEVRSVMFFAWTKQKTELE